MSKKRPPKPAREAEGPILDISGKKYASAQPTLSDLAEAIRRGWAVDPVRKAMYMAALDEEVKNRHKLETEQLRANVVIGANRIYQMEQASALKDLQQREKDARIDSGKDTERVGGGVKLSVAGLETKD